MARGINKVLLIGNLGKDPESRTFPNGGSVTNITLATSESWRDSQGNQQERTEWHNVVFHNKLGEIAAQYLRKGSKVYIEGALRTRKWQDKSTGQDRYITEVHVNELQMLDGKPASAAPGPAPAHSYGTQGRNEYRDAKGGHARPQQPASGFDDEQDPDIPF